MQPCAAGKTMEAASPDRPATPRLAGRYRGPIDAFLDPRLFRALGDPTRARLFACLSKCGRPCSVSEVAECCSVDLSVVSRHLSLMARAGALAATRRGRVVLYRVRSRELVGVLRGLADAIEACCASPEENACCGRADASAGGADARSRPATHRSGDASGSKAADHLAGERSAQPRDDAEGRRSAAR
ncbi:MAG TPA: metalloregulator ArsR/SmtB family transcription factor [Phycisphaerales bacterium]|nr:metalloregulator ArsR/SmtB family transcription factor [Phycisphaerales bacterium]HMP37004.1 metalloregulator ArsR/SmtB family transcription factor [Phycisphaerales bacterium]